MKKEKLRYVILWLVAMLAGAQVDAQQMVSSGRVTSVDNGQPILGVSVAVVGTSTTTQTDKDGKYIITTIKGNTLRFSYVGFRVQDVEVGEQQRINVRLQPEDLTLDEVVVVAYGIATKSEITGSVATLDAADLQNRTVTNITNALAGMAPGVSVSSGNGQPGTGASIRLRGIGSMNASSEPLLVVDGAAFDGQIGDINADDIENISVLKDATSAALYGSRAGNGVVLITTKKGKGAPSLRIDLKQGISERAISEYDRVGVYDYYPLVFRAIKHSKMFPSSGTGLSEADANQYALANLKNSLVYNPFNVEDDKILDNKGIMNPDAQLKYDDFDWYGAIQRTGKRQEANMNLSGSGDNTNYYLSLGYLDDQGYLLKSDFRRYNGRINIDSKVRDWLKIGLNIYGANSDGNLATDASTGNGNANAYVNPFNFIRGMGPIYPVHAFNQVTGAVIIDPLTGQQFYDYGMHPEAVNRPTGAGQGRHVIYETLLNPNNNARVLLGGRGFADFNFLQYFTFTPSISIDHSNRNYEYSWNNIVGDGVSSDGLAVVNNYVIRSYTFNQILSYRRKFGNHDLQVLGGHENYDYHYKERTAGASGQIVSGIPELLNYVLPNTASGKTNVNRLESYFAKTSYNYRNRYYVDASVRTDGSSIFHSDERWGTFYSVGAAWKLSEETFLQYDWLNDLRLRSSYGQVGNNQLIDRNGNPIYYGYQGLYDLGYNNGSFPGTLLYSLPNPKLTWETSNSFNVGLDFSMLANRLRGSVEYYRRGSDQLLMSVPNPLSTAVSFTYKNVGSMYNKGVEISLTADIIRKEQLRWTITNNWATFKNEITKMPTETPSVITDAKRREVGQDFYSFWLRQYAGVDPSDGAALYIPADDATADAKRTVNGKEYVTNQNFAKYDYSGSAIPKWTGSMQQDLDYRGFGLSVLMTYQIGGKIYDSQYASLMSPSSYGKAFHVDALDAWTTENTTSKIPRMDQGNTNIYSASSRWLTDATYFSIRNASLFYRFPKIWLQHAGLSAARIAVSGENLMLTAKRKGLNPTEQFDGTNSTTYLPTRIWGLSLQATF